MQQMLPFVYYCYYCCHYEVLLLLPSLWVEASLHAALATGRAAVLLGLLLLRVWLQDQ
jgi:hypothetical protein